MASNLKRIRPDRRSDLAILRKARKLKEEERLDVSDSVPGGNEDNDGNLAEASARSRSGKGLGPTVMETTSALPIKDAEAGENLNKPPTGAGLRVIKDAANLFGSGSFKLQIDALLPNVRPKPSRIPPLNRFLLDLHSLILDIPSVSPQHPLDAAKQMRKKGVAVPYAHPLPTEETNWKVGYDSPSDITLVGSWANKISVKPKDGIKYGVDLAVEMPDGLFQEKDYLNARFFQKRAFYLSVIAAAIKSSKKIHVDLFYESPSGDPRLTNIALTPRKDVFLTDFTKLNAKVVLIPVLLNTSPIPFSRLSPKHSNIRLFPPQGDPQPRQVPSPTYNNILLHAFTPRAHLLLVHSLKQESPAFRDAVTLLRVWASQRILRRFWEYVLILSLVVLGEEQGDGKGLGLSSTRRKALGRGLSSYQMFKAALDFLAKFKFEKEAVFVKSAHGHKFPPDEHDVNQQPVFVDSSSINLLSDVPRGSLGLLRYEAVKTSELLNQAAVSDDSFMDVFLKDHRNLLTRFDNVLRVDIRNAKPMNPSLGDTIDKGSSFNALLSSIDTLLHHGLGDRIKAITIVQYSSHSRAVDQAHPSNPETIYIGLLYNSQHATRLVDHGPPADEQDQSAIKTFRDFWGNKAELRRFKDGRIIESVVWDVKTADERAHVPAMIVRFVLKRHFGIDESAIQSWQADFDMVLRLPESISTLYIKSGQPVGFKSAITAFDNLVKAIKDLEDELPLMVLNVSPISEALRYTSVFSPVPVPNSLAGILPPNARYLPHFDIIIEFEKSSKWPDNLKAIQKIKLAFFEKIASALMKSTQGLKANVVVGDGVDDSSVLDSGFLEIVTPEGWAFSARIWNQREAILLDRIVAGQDKVLSHVKPLQNDKQHRGKEFHDATVAREVYTRRFINATKHHRAIAALCHRYGAYAGTVRLVKRWLGAHWLLGGHVSGEAVEILCASFFVGDGRYLGRNVEQVANQPVSVTKERGFAEVIAFLKDWKWEEGVFVPLYGTQEDKGGIKEGEGIEAGNGNDAPGSMGGGQQQVKASNTSAWLISTELDKEGKAWTSKGPDVVVAHRIKALAQATWEYLQRIEQGSLNVQALFIHPTDDYDFIIHLNPTALPRYVHNVALDLDVLSKRGRYANIEQDVVIRPGFDPARLFFDDLQRVYADTFKVFYDPHGGDHFGAVWDPSVKQPRSFRVLGGFSSEPLQKGNDKTKDKGQVALNQGAILNEIERLGNGLVSKIVVQT